MAKGVLASRAVHGGVLSAAVENDEVVGGGVCSFEQMVSEARVDSRTGVVCRLQHLWLSCDSVAPQKEEPRCLQSYDTDP
eukprot:scaffold20076_cov145-Isochrysis_galbana.AAC.1